MSIGAAPLGAAALSDGAGPPAPTKGPKPRMMVAKADAKIVPERR